MEKSISFMYAAIEDTPNIIRAIDIKMKIDFGILIVPATNVGDIITTSVLASTKGVLAEILKRRDFSHSMSLFEKNRSLIEANQDCVPTAHVARL